MNHFIGIFPDTDTKVRISSVLGDVGKVFENHDIPVRYSDRDTYHITLLHFGDSLGAVGRTKIRFKLRNFKLHKFQISLSDVRLGISGKHRELLYLSVEDGADQLREMVLQLSNRLGQNRNRKMFIPHVTLGRVRRDMSNEEFLNISRSLKNFNDSREGKKISFQFTGFELVASDKGAYTSVRKFDV